MQKYAQCLKIPNSQKPLHKTHTENLKGSVWLSVRTSKTAIFYYHFFHKCFFPGTLGKYPEINIL